MANRDVNGFRTRACQTCGADFTYKIGKGNDRVHCGAGCRIVNQQRLHKERYKTLPLCKVDGCTMKATRIGPGLCEKHFGRMRTRGSLHDRVIIGRYTRPDGYILRLARGHPLANSDGLVSEHRLVAYQTNEGIAPPCFWCGVELDWPTVVVDHLNDVRDDNRPENLVVSCNNCNRARGAIIPFLQRLTEQGRSRFVRYASEAYRE